MSPPVYLCRGLHQGSPLSPILFLLVAQVFTKKLKLNDKVKGIKVNGVELLLSLFADDTDMCLEATGECVDEVIAEIRDFGVVSGCKGNLEKTKCVPFGKSKSDSILLSHLSNRYGTNFLTNNFTALGIQFNNFSSINDISNLNYVKKLEKAKARVKFWKSRDLTVFGKVTIIKSLLMAQFVYLIVPLPRPDSKMISTITKFLFHFLWGGKCDKVKRDIVTQQRDQGGLNMFYPCDFILSLKLKLIQKIFDESFSHSWKDIVLKQLLWPNYPIICFESGLVNSKYAFTADLVKSLSDWKIKSAENKGTCINHCVWGNSAITDIGSKLWVPKLVTYNIMYLSDFVNSEGNVMTYREFCTTTLAGCWHVVTNSEYVNVKMAIRRYSVPTIAHKNLSNINQDLCLSFFTNYSSQQLKGHTIREMLCKNLNTNELTPLKSWREDLGVESVDWVGVWSNLYSNFTNNYKLMQFQYKLLMKISTCRYMRYKMKIDTESAQCYHCNSGLETLPHIFLTCPVTKSFLGKVVDCIVNSIQGDYSDPSQLYYITCSHANPLVNFIWAVAKLYISRQFQLQKELNWNGFRNTVGTMLYGERDVIVQSIRPVLELV